MEASDVRAPSTCPITDWEVKGTQVLSVRKVLERAIEEAGHDRVAVAWYKNHERAVAILDLEYFVELLAT